MVDLFWFKLVLVLFLSSCGTQSQQRYKPPMNASEPPSGTGNSADATAAPASTGTETTISQGDDAGNQQEESGKAKPSMPANNEEEAGTGEPEMENAEAESSEPDGCELALASFTENIRPAIVNSCIGCHGAMTSIAGAFLSRDDDENNRAAFLLFDSSVDGSVLFEKISGAAPHGGGVLSDQLPEQAISVWKTAEQGCIEN